MIPITNLVYNTLFWGGREKKLQYQSSNKEFKGATVYISSSLDGPFTKVNSVYLSGEDLCIQADTAHLQKIMSNIMKTSFSRIRHSLVRQVCLLFNRMLLY